MTYSHAVDHDEHFLLTKITGIEYKFLDLIDPNIKINLTIRSEDLRNL